MKNMLQICVFGDKVIKKLKQQKERSKKLNFLFEKWHKYMLKNYRHKLSYFVENNESKHFVWNSVHKHDA